MMDSRKNDTERAFRRLMDDIRRERIPNHILALADELQATLDARQAEADEKPSG